MEDIKSGSARSLVALAFICETHVAKNLAFSLSKILPFFIVYNYAKIIVVIQKI